MTEDTTETHNMNAWGIGLATVADDGHTLDVWYPHPHLGERSNSAPDAELFDMLSELERRDEARGVHTQVVTCTADLEDRPQSTADAYLRLHLLSHRLVKPNTINLDGIFSRLPSVVWTSAGPCPIDDFEETRLRLRQHLGRPATVTGVDKFPPMVNYVVPDGVRIADGAKVRLGAYLSKGTTVMHAAFVNFNAGTLGRSLIEGRISRGVVIGDGSDVGGGASTIGALSGSGDDQVRLGKRCLLGANSGLGIPLGDDCVIEAGLFLTADTQVALMPGGGVIPGANGLFAEPRTVEARELAGASNVLFKRSVSGRIEAHARGGRSIEWNDPQQHHRENHEDD